MVDDRSFRFRGRVYPSMELNTARDREGNLCSFGTMSLGARQ